MVLIMPSIQLRGITNFICRNVDLEIDRGEFLVLLGPNGSGKTTLLNVIAGLAEYRGSVLFDGSGVDEVPPHRRGIGYIFQDLALFPHLDVRSNIAFGLEAHKQDRGEVQGRVKEMMALTRIESLAHRYPAELSGGERQRVAIARALAPHPRALLLDEPFNSLDIGITKHLRLELKDLQRRLGLTTVFVTHNQKEAEELGDRIAVLRGGELMQVGTPEEIFFEPHNEQVAEFIGSPNIFLCEQCRELVNGLAEVRCRGMSIVVPYEGDPVSRVAVLPRDVYISATEPPGHRLNRYRGRIIRILPSAYLTRLTLQVAEQIITCEQPTAMMEKLGLQPGDEVYLILRLRWLRTITSGGSL